MGYWHSYLSGVCCSDLHMVQLMPLPPIISCFSKMQNGLPFWCRLTRVVLEKRLLNVCVCVCVRVHVRVRVHVCVWAVKPQLSQIQYIRQWHKIVGALA